MQYKKLRIKVASIYESQDPSDFGNVKLGALQENLENLHV